MSHRATVIREINKVKPQWFEYIKVKSDNVPKVILMQDLDSYYFNYYNLKNVVIEVIDSTTSEFIWQGVINQEVLNIGDKLNLGLDTVTIIDVEKNVNGSVLYTVESITINCDNYDILLKNCKLIYDYMKNRVDVEVTSI